jgi:hypothetical protein
MMTQQACKTTIHGIVREGMRLGMVLGLVAATLCLTAAAHAQPTSDSLALANAYGTGVHAFYSGDLDRSIADLTAAIEGGTADPRAWYFRGLSAWRLGRLDEAEADFREGAEREASTVGSWPVSRSLERVQGTERLRLERYRTRARVAALERDRALIRRRYVEIEDAQPEVLRQRRPLPATPATDDVFAAPAERVPAPAAAQVDEPVEPAEPENEPAEREEPVLPAEAAEPAESPFGDSAPKAEAEPAAEADDFQL